jgi:hypothetical protein
VTNSLPGGPSETYTHDIEIIAQNESAAIHTLTSVTMENLYETFYDYKSFDDAEASCVTWGGHLASVANEIEYNLIGDMLLSGSKYWIGAKTNANNE